MEDVKCFANFLVNSAGDNTLVLRNRLRTKMQSLIATRAMIGHLISGSTHGLRLSSRAARLIDEALRGRHETYHDRQGICHALESCPRVVGQFGVEAALRRHRLQVPDPTNGGVNPPLRPIVGRIFLFVLGGGFFLTAWDDGS
jgi:hypothetical protein